MPGAFTFSLTEKIALKLLLKWTKKEQTKKRSKKVNYRACGRDAADRIGRAVQLFFNL